MHHFHRRCQYNTVAMLFKPVAPLRFLKIEEEIIMVYSASSEIPEEEVLFELKKHLASYMVPSQIIYKKSLPLLQSDKNKINKDVLRKELSAK